MPRTRTRESSKKIRKPATRGAPARMRGSPESGASTREQVLQAARDVLVEEGYANLSIRRVADAVGITVGNLTYHFPSKQELVRALIALLISGYENARQELYREVLARPERRVERLIEWVMKDSASTATNRLFRELWAMAPHDPVVARAVDDLYDLAITSVAGLLRDTYATLVPSDALALAHMIALISEGTSVIYGTRPDRKVTVEQLARVVTEVIAPSLNSGLTASRSSARRVSSG